MVRTIGPSPMGPPRFGPLPHAPTGAGAPLGTAPPGADLRVVVDAATHPAIDAQRARRLATGLVAAAAVYAVGLVGMLAAGASSPPAHLLDDLADFEAGLALYRWGFAGASLLAPAFVALLLLLVTAAAVPLVSARRWVGTALLAAYVPFATVAYVSQYAVLPRLVDRFPDTAAAWYFQDVDSIPYGLDLAGYAVLGLAAIVLASAIMEAVRTNPALDHAPPERYVWLARWLAAMGALSVIAFALYAAGVGAAGIVSLASAALTVPVVAIAVLEARRLRGAGA